MPRMQLQLHGIVRVEQRHRVFEPDEHNGGFVFTRFVFTNKDGEQLSVDVFSDGGLSVVGSNASAGV